MKQLDNGNPKPSAIRRSASRTPYNPGLHRLVSGRRDWAEPLDAEAKAEGFVGWHQRGYLPHRDMPGLIQFLTFRLCDAMPLSRRSEWEAILTLEIDRERRVRLEEYLDQGAGECWLRQPAIAALTENALRFFDGQRYELKAWVVMPNHVHALVEVAKTPLGSIVQSWKRHIAREANKLLGREGAFWEHEYWDTYIRNATHLAKAVRYIEMNPVKGGLVREALAWRWSSARLRDEYGRLTVGPPPLNK